jgi:threonine/homoserine/homoserine lactone efflux protein
MIPLPGSPTEEVSRVCESVLLGPLVLFASVMSLTPGPNVVMVTASTASFGFRRVVPQMLGVTLGFGLLIIAAGLGLAGVLHAEPRLQKLTRVAGAGYLLYLAWRIAQSESSANNSTSAKPIGFFEAMLLQWINPKGWVFALGALTAYATPAGDVFGDTFIIAAICAFACLASLVIWGGFGASIGRLLRSPGARLAFNWSMASLLVLSLIPVLA